MGSGRLRKGKGRGRWEMKDGEIRTGAGMQLQVQGCEDVCVHNGVNVG